MSVFYDSLPYTTDYAKSGRAGCRWCREKIAKGELRLAAMVQSNHHDGRDPYWYHQKCFFAKYRFLSVDDISNFDALKLEDQEQIKKYLAGGTRLSPKENPQKSGINGLVNSGEFHVGYAKSNQSHCVSCEGRIAKGEVRVSQMDYTSERALLIPTGKMDRWHHEECFVRNREKLEFFGNGNTLPGISSLQPSDRANFLTRLGKSRSKFRVEYAKSNMSRCVSCEGLIAKDEVRISQIDYTSEKALLIESGKMDRWHHVDCFVKDREKLEFFENVNTLPGISFLKQSDRENLLSVLPSSIQPPKEGPVAVYVDCETISKPVDCDQNGLDEQEQMIASVKDTLAKNLGDKDLLSQLLTINNQEVPVGLERILERVADIMIFGALERCKICNGQFLYKKGVGYQCLGYIDSFLKCTKVVKEPVRCPFEIPHDLKDNPAFHNYSFISRNRIIPPVNEKSIENEVDEPPRKLPKIDKLPLMNMKFLISDGIINEALRIHLKNQIGRYGGKVMGKISHNITAIISTPDEVKKMTKRMEYAKQSHIPVISANFANSIPQVNFIFADLMKKFSICDWMSFGNSRPALQSIGVNVNRPQSNQNC